MNPVPLWVHRFSPRSVSANSLRVTTIAHAGALLYNTKRYSRTVKHGDVAEDSCGVVLGEDTWAGTLATSGPHEKIRGGHPRSREQAA